jgi:diguanylate cyclase (GGDEF)-like protein
MSSLKVGEGSAGKRVDQREADAETLSALLDISQEVFSTLDFNEILYQIVKRVAGVIQVIRSSILLVDEKKQVGKVLATYENPESGDIRIDLYKYPEIREAMKGERMVLVRDIALDPLMAEFRKPLLDLGIKSILVIPLIDIEREKGRVMGTLYLRTSRGEAGFTDAEIHFCRIVANIASVALKNAALFSRLDDDRKRLEKLAVTDDLTQLYNHRYFAKRLGEEFKRTHRHGAPLSCIMLDIDDFKRVNDRYGHQQGDIVLQEVAGLIQGSIRETDIPARYGGEEFAIILPHTPVENALLLADRIRQTVHQTRFSGLADDHPVTVSLGIATYPDPLIRSADDLIGMADQGLYKAKMSGKNRVHLMPSRENADEKEKDVERSDP